MEKPLNIQMEKFTLEGKTPDELRFAKLASLSTFRMPLSEIIIRVKAFDENSFNALVVVGKSLVAEALEIAEREEIIEQYKKDNTI